MEQLKSILIIASLILSLITIACQTNKRQSSQGLVLSNQWIISRFDEENNPSAPITKNSFIVINAKENKFNGNAECNTISGNLIVAGSIIKFEKIVATNNSCQNLDQENKFIKTLERTSNFRIVGCELFLYNGNKKILTLESCR